MAESKSDKTLMDSSNIPTISKPEIISYQTAFPTPKDLVDNYNRFFLSGKTNEFDLLKLQLQLSAYGFTITPDAPSMNK